MDAARTGHPCRQRFLKFPETLIASDIFWDRSHHTEGASTELTSESPGLGDSDSTAESPEVGVLSTVVMGHWHARAAGGPGTGQ